MSDINEAPTREQRPLSELHGTGLLWLINRVCFHPRGFAFALHYDEGVDGEAEYVSGEPTGWSVLWDGTEPGTFPPEVDDEMFAAVERFLSSLRPQELSES